MVAKIKKMALYAAEHDDEKWFQERLFSDPPTLFLKNKEELAEVINEALKTAVFYNSSNVVKWLYQRAELTRETIETVIHTALEKKSCELLSLILLNSRKCQLPIDLRLVQKSAWLLLHNKYLDEASEFIGDLLDDEEFLMRFFYLAQGANRFYLIKVLLTKKPTFIYQEDSLPLLYSLALKDPILLKMLFSVIEADELSVFCFDERILYLYDLYVHHRFDREAGMFIRFDKKQGDLRQFYLPKLLFGIFINILPILFLYLIPLLDREGIDLETMPEFWSEYRDYKKWIDTCEKMQKLLSQFFSDEFVAIFRESPEEWKIAFLNALGILPLVRLFKREGGSCEWSPDKDQRFKGCPFTDVNINQLAFCLMRHDSAFRYIRDHFDQLEAIETLFKKTFPSSTDEFEIRQEEKLTEAKFALMEKFSKELGFVFCLSNTYHEIILPAELYTLRELINQAGSFSRLKEIETFDIEKLFSDSSGLPVRECAAPPDPLLKSSDTLVTLMTCRGMWSTTPEHYTGVVAKILHERHVTDPYKGLETPLTMGEILQTESAGFCAR